MPEGSLDKNQLARQRKKIEKDRRRKQYDDLQVQGTNNSSIVSKRSVEMIYTSKLNPEMGEWFKYFVKKPKRRSPAINRGYWIRMESIKQMILRIIDSREDANQEVTIVNLGCGFDPLPFQLLTQFAKTNTDVKLHFLDVDYPELIANKLEMIKSSPEILSILGKEVNDTSIEKSVVPFMTENYKLVGCDLKDGNLYKQQLNRLLGDSPCIKIFVAEVSLAYMKPEYANPIIEHSAKLDNSHFLILEQILPAGESHAFAQKMLYHFNHLRSPLQCVQTYPLKTDQVNRFKNYYQNVEIKDLFENWKFLIDDQLKHKIKDIEEFDEWEEFIIFCQHYVIVHATNRPVLIYDDKPIARGELDEPSTLVNVSYQDSNDSELLKSKFAAITGVGDEVLINGGLFQTRTGQTLSLKKGHLEVKTVQGDEPGPRMCHTLTALNNSESILIGGRSRPDQYFLDVYKLDGENWTQLQDLPEKRSRHITVKLSGKDILIFGGLQENSKDMATKLFLVYNCESQQYKSLKIEGSIPNLFSCSMVYNEELEFGLILGGMVNTTIPTVNDCLYRFVIKEDTIVVDVIYQHSYLLRISCQSKLFSDNKLLIIGGVSPLDIFNQQNTILLFDIITSKLHPIEIDRDIWVNHPPIFIGFGKAEIGNSVICLGGGAVCYSFGSCYNGIYKFDYYPNN
ncbi:uncharacterized protein AC631_03185 [Debaryomyces fabryi]|uniref:tRNA wybutosine-synthesizing protein 4 n=1 Tax=Debaryomyces fabryi TaxID=58627 RepID=A0A0V1PYA9_9ASCO|nr:uncharacterized protein AC631_03185 [Debaryomyces fabryi]KSA01061.1 hypothetical protein AC631_03185 [Debaryomyces fabryi]CUM47648.1 unnamed protein product [Debaryomyces fabryi]